MSTERWLVVALAAVVLCGCGANVDLKFRPKAGDCRVVRAVTNQTVSMDLMGQNREQPDVQSMAFTYDVEDVDPAGTATIKVTIDEANLGNMSAMSGMMAGAGADMSGPGGDDLGLAGRSFSMKVTPAGRVQELKGMAQAVEEVAQKATEKATEMVTALWDEQELPPEVKAQMGTMTGAIATQLRRALGDSAMRENMEDMMTMYPEEPVKVGATWTKGVVLSHGMAPMVKGEAWKLTGRKNGIVTLEVQATITPNTSAPAINMGFATMGINLSGQTQGTVEMEEATGWIKKAHFAHELEGEITMKMSAGFIPGSQSMPTKIKGTTTIESYNK